MSMTESVCATSAGKRRLAMTDLFDLAKDPEIAALRRAGAWPAFHLGVQFWRLPGPENRCVTEEEALAWLRGLPPNPSNERK
jgi:hypothetical protein